MSGLWREGEASQCSRDVTDHRGQCGLKRARINHERHAENERSDSNPLQSLDAPLVLQIPENPVHYCGSLFAHHFSWGEESMFINSFLTLALRSEWNTSELQSLRHFL